MCAGFAMYFSVCEYCLVYSVSICNAFVVCGPQTVGEIFHTVWICNGLLVRFFINYVGSRCSLWAIFVRQCLYFQCVFLWSVGEIFVQQCVNLHLQLQILFSVWIRDVVCW